MLTTLSLDVEWLLGNIRSNSLNDAIANCKGEVNVHNAT